MQRPSPANDAPRGGHRPRRPIEPPPTKIRFPDPSGAPAHGLLAAGGDLRPGTLLAAYRRGIFPWPDQAGDLLWWSPDPRAILPLEGFHESRSLRRLRRKRPFDVTVNRSFRDVMETCGDRPEGTWITPAMVDAYVELHRLGWAHSLEAWRGKTLAGGVYGVAVGGLFVAESMFHRESNASKVALAELVERLRRHGFRLLDVQFRTDHLASMGVIEISRRYYLEEVPGVIEKTVSFETPPSHGDG